MNTLKLAKLSRSLSLSLLLCPALAFAEESSPPTSAAVSAPATSVDRGLYDVSLADLSFTDDVIGIRTNGALQGYEISKTEFFLKDRLTGEANIETLAEPAASAEAMRQMVLTEDSIWGQDCLLVLYCAGQPHDDANRRFLTHKIEIQLDIEFADSARLHSLADAAGVVVSREMNQNGRAVLHATCGGSAIKAAAMLEQQADVLGARPMLTLPMVKCSLPTDQYFNPGNQWYVHPAGAPLPIFVTDVWCGGAPLQQRYFGRGIDISILDDGVQGDHPDLDHAYSFRKDTDFVDGDNDGFPETAQNNHGTEMAGIVSMRHNNGIGGAGIAPAAEIFSVRVFGANDPESLADAHEHQANIVDIVLLGFTAGGDYVDISELLTDTFENLAERKDAAIVYPAGDNGGSSRMDYDRAAAHRHTIACAAFPGASEPGSAIIVTGPGRDMTTTDRTGDDGDENGDYFFDFGSTSAAAAATAGVVALMQDARRDLGWRDIQEILLLTSNPLPGTVGNGAVFFTPLGVLPFKFSYQYGAGMLFGHDVFAGFGAVSLAEVWPLLPTGPGAYKKATIRADQRRVDVGAATEHFIFDFGRVVPSNRNMRIEHMEIAFEWEEPPNGETFADLTPVEVELYSPYYLNAATRPGAMRSLVSTKAGGVNAPVKWTYTTVRHWGQINDGGFERTGWPGRPSRVMTPAEWEMEVSIEPTPAKPIRRLVDVELTAYGTEENTPPLVISANIAGSGNPDVFAPRTVFADEDLIISDAVFYDAEGDPLSARTQWQVLDEDGLTWVDLENAQFEVGACSYTELVKIITRNDVGGNLDGTYFIVYQPDGTSVAFWFQMNRSTVIPAGAAAADRAVTVLGTVTNEGAAGVAADIIAAVNRDGFFAASVLGAPTEIAITYAPGSIDVPDPQPGTTRFSVNHEVIDDPAGNCFGTIPARLAASDTLAAHKYRAIITPRDRLREGFRFITPQIIVNSRPVLTGVYGQPYFYDADLWIETVPPEDLDPFAFINEVSQGTGDRTTNTEWVEIMINYSTDMRGYKLANDIASFDLTFTQNEIWEEVPYGTLIVIYNGDQPDAILPPETPLEDFGVETVWVISSGNAALFTLPTNGNGWGEFSNVDAALCDPGRLPACDGANAALLTQFAARNPIHGVSFNGNKRFLNNNPDPLIYLLAAAQQSVFFDGTDLLPVDPTGAPTFSPVDQIAWVDWTSLSATSFPNAFDATPGEVNSANNQAILDQINFEMKTSIPTYRFYPGDGTQQQIDPITGALLGVPDLVASDLVPGLRIDRKTGVVRGIPNVPMGGVFTIKIQRSHSFSSEIQIYDLVILEAPPLVDGEDEDGDGINNLLEEALVSNPFVAEANVLPTGQIVAVAGMSYPSISFRRLKGGFLDAATNVYTVGDLEYTVEASRDLRTWRRAPEIFVLQESVFDFPGDPLGNTEIATFRAFDSIGSPALGEVYYLRLSVTRLP